MDTNRHTSRSRGRVRRSLVAGAAVLAASAAGVLAQTTPAMAAEPTSTFTVDRSVEIESTMSSPDAWQADTVTAAWSGNAAYAEQGVLMRWDVAAADMNTSLNPLNTAAWTP